MWLVSMPNGKTYIFDKDEAAQFFMLHFIADEIAMPVSREERSRLINELTKAFQNRSQLREGWGVGKDITASFKED